MAALAPRRTSDETDSIAIPAAPPARAPQPLRPPTLQMTIYFSADGTLHHTRCRTPLHFRGIRAEIESDFFCTTCHEHVAVPRFAVSQIPVETENEKPTVEPPVMRLVRREGEKRSSAG